MKRTPTLTSPAAIPLLEPLEPRTLLAAWGPSADLIDQDQAALRFKSIQGQGQSVAIIDSGVNYKHPALGGQWGRTVIAGHDFVDRDTDPMDKTGHGTQIASIIAAKPFTFAGHKYRGIAPAVKIIALRVTTGREQTVPDRRIEQALQWVLKHRIQYNITAINLSFGSGSYAANVSKSPYGDELAKLFKGGVFIAAASGNAGLFSAAGIAYPAAHPNVYAIGSVDSSNLISGFTSRGPLLNLLAPGENIPTAWYDRPTRTYTYIEATGTSYSTPYAVGAAILIRQLSPRLKPAQILSILKSTAAESLDAPEGAPSTGQLFPRLDLDDALARAKAS